MKSTKLLVTNIVSALGILVGVAAAGCDGSETTSDRDDTANPGSIANPIEGSANPKEGVADGNAGGDGQCSSPSTEAPAQANGETPDDSKCEGLTVESIGCLEGQPVVICERSASGAYAWKVVCATPL